MLNIGKHSYHIDIYIHVIVHVYLIKIKSKFAIYEYDYTEYIMHKSSIVKKFKKNKRQFFLLNKCRNCL